MPTENEAPSRQYSALGVGVTLPREEVVGTLSTLAGQRMKLTDLFVHRVLVVQNPRTGQVRHIPYGEHTPFGSDQIPTHTVIQAWNTAQPQSTGTFAYAAESKGARAPHRSIDAEWKDKGGNPRHRSIFKKIGGFKLTLGS